MLINILLTFILLLKNGSTGNAESVREKRKADCDCYVDGVYYVNGDTWQDKENPCIVYKCDNGYFKAIVIGCMYNNECKDVGKQWTDKCFTYQCFQTGNTAYYNLIEGGCLDMNGNCLRFGQRSQINCDMVECQIVGDCYKATTIVKGCRIDNNYCKPLHSFWNVGCSVFQCIQEGQRTRYIKLENDIMNWPEGEYSLLMSKHGCPPRALPGEWETGSRLHYSFGQSYVSNEFDAFGKYSAEFFQHHFCSHVDKQDRQRIPRYQTYWDPGNYCVLRRNGKCPTSFTEGSLAFEDFDGVEVLGNNGTLPDGYYDTNTTMFFCCRSDGSLDKPIVLPRDFPFILFMVKGKGECQTVRGMIHEMEYFAFNSERQNGTVYENGSTPLTTYDKNSTMLYFCYYKPLQCGCRDDAGNIIEVGERFKKDCVEYICQDYVDYQDLVIIHGGCMYNGECKKEGATWIESSGETCQVKECKRQGLVMNTTFSVVDTLTGCKDEEYCRPPGYQKSRGCYVMQCMKKIYNNQMDFILKKAGCSDGRGGCIPLGKIVIQRCFVLKCRKEPSKCGLEVVKGGCRWKNKCKIDGEQWNEDEHCLILKCKVTRSSKGWMVNIKSTPSGCNADGKCIDIMANITHPNNCGTYQCKEFRKGNKSYASLSLIDIGCRYQSRCRANGEEWDDDKNCCTKKCMAAHTSKGWKIRILSNANACKNATGGCLKLGTKVRDHNCFERQCIKKNGHAYMAVSSGGCRYQNKCRGNGEEWDDVENCRTRRCTATQSSAGWKIRILSNQTGCKNGTGGCLKLGTKLRDPNCFERQCIQRNGHTYMAVSNGGCRYQNKCRGNGEEWDDVENCRTRRCTATPSSEGWKIRILSNQTGCKNGTNGCIKLGEKIRDQHCFEKQCTVQYGHAYMTISNGGCKVDGKCIKHMDNITHPMNCATYQCKSGKTGGRWYSHLGFVNAGCRWKDKCRAHGEEWDDDGNCIKQKCSATKTSQGWDLKIPSTPKACTDANKHCPQCG